MNRTVMRDVCLPILVYCPIISSQVMLLGPGTGSWVTTVDVGFTTVDVESAWRITESRC